MHILVADDDESNLAFLSDLLRAWGHVVTTARDGLHALRAVRQDPDIQLAIMNWLMPQMDGLRASAAMKRLTGRNIRTVVLVGRDFCDEVHSRFPAYSDNYLAKPVDPQSLLSMLRQMGSLDRPRPVAERALSAADAAASKSGVQG